MSSAKSNLFFYASLFSFSKFSYFLFIFLICLIVWNSIWFFSFEAFFIPVTFYLFLTIRYFYFLIFSVHFMALYFMYPTSR